MQNEISTRLLEWYALHARDLPWRKSRDPYEIWVAEIMLQQTRVDTVLPYYERWLKRFPGINELAESSQHDVLNLWEGLGYYSRARNFHLAAQIVVREFGGVIPQEPELLVKLPGIGKAGAADISSIAFGKDIGTVEGNIRRIVARLLDLSTTLGTKTFESQIQTFINANLPAGKAGDYNQAWMDLGATICTPENPNCQACPLRNDCIARKNGTQTRRPIRQMKNALPEIVVTAGILFDNSRERVLITRRPQKGLLGGLWEFPGGKLEADETLEVCLAREWMEELGIAIQVGQQQGKYKHAYSHFKVLLYTFFCHSPMVTPLTLVESEYAWVQVGELDSYPMGKIDRMISRSLSKQITVPYV